MRTHKLLFTLLVLLFLTTGVLVFYYLKEPQIVHPARGVVAAGKEVVTVLFPNEQGRLEKKIVEVQKQLPDKAKGDTLFRELKQARCIPDRLKLYELAFGQDGVIYLNISKEFTERTGTAREMAMTYGIVNSFIESFKNVKSVQLLVEGQPIYTRSGLLYLYEPLRFNKDVLED
jgi:hypothetical protein